MSDNTLTLYDVAKALVVPPGSLIALFALGVLFLAAGWRRLGFFVTVITLVTFYLLATPFVAARLGAMIQSVDALKLTELADPQPGAIVVLAAGLLPYAPEYEGGAVDDTTLQRLAYAAFLHRQTGISILVSGGGSREAAGSLADLMEQSLERSFGVPVKWSENKSIDTYENAQMSAAILREAGVSHIILVTHAAHMARSAGLFRMTGLTVTPAPTAFVAGAGRYTGRFLPRQSAFSASYYAIYELVGSWWYVLRGRLREQPAAVN